MADRTFRDLLGSLVMRPEEMGVDEVSDMLGRVLATAADQPMEDQETITDAQLGAFLVGLLGLRKPTLPTTTQPSVLEYPADLLAACAEKMLLHATPFYEDKEALARACTFDIVGTGGDGKNTFNASTTAALVAAACGVPMAKHGNRASSSSCGSADLLEKAGYMLTHAPATGRAMLHGHQFTFLHAAAYHPTLRRLASARRSLGCPTLFNLLGPLVNPAHGPRGGAVVGVARASLGPVMARALAARHPRARILVVHGAIGLDEISPEGPTYTWSVSSEGEVLAGELTPASFGVPERPLARVRGGDAAYNTAILHCLLKKDRAALQDDVDLEAMRDFVCMNASAVLVLAGRAETYIEGMALCRDVLDNGSVATLLQNITHHSAST